MNSWVSIEIPISYQLYIIWHGYMWNYKCTHIIYKYIQYITLISYAHFVWLISIHFPASLRNKITPPFRTAHTTRPEGDSSHVPTHPKRTYNSPGGKKLPSRLAESREPWGLLSTKSVAIVPDDEKNHQLVILKVYVWGLGDGKSVLSTCKKRCSWKKTVCSGSIDSKKKFGRGLPRNDCLRSSWKIKVFSGSLDATKSSGAVYQEMGSNIMD